MTIHSQEASINKSCSNTPPLNIQDLGRKYQFCLLVRFASELFPESRLYIYDSSERAFYVANFCQECETNSCGTEK